jgi:hypothetical protein
MILANRVGHSAWPEADPASPDPAAPFLKQLLDSIDVAAQDSALHFGLDWSWQYLPELRLIGTPERLPDVFPEEARNYYRGNPYDPRVLGCIVRLELLELLRVAREKRKDLGPLSTKLLLLVDDVHRTRVLPHSRCLAMRIRSCSKGVWRRRRGLRGCVS